MIAHPPVGPNCRHIYGSEFANDTVGIRAGMKHLGIDFQPKIAGGTSPIYAVVGGRVEALFTDIEPGDWSNPLYPGHTGNIVAIRDDIGRVWTYQHGRNFRVKIGQRVEAGTLLCDMWKSGHATNSHLHLGLRVGGAWKNPAPVLKQLGVWPLTYKYGIPPLVPATSKPISKPAAPIVVTPPAKEWSDMATEAQIRAVVHDELLKTKREITAHTSKAADNLRKDIPKLAGRGVWLDTQYPSRAPGADPKAKHSMAAHLLATNGQVYAVREGLGPILGLLEELQHDHTKTAEEMRTQIGSALSGLTFELVTSPQEDAA